MLMWLMYASAVTLCVCKKNKSYVIWAFCFFLILSGLGSFYNNGYRIGDLMLGDIGLFLCLGVFSVEAIKSSKVPRRIVLILLVFMFALLMGLIHGNEASHIFRDVKCFLYFFVSYGFCSSIKNDRDAVRCIALAFIAVAIFTTITSLNSFLSVGMSDLDSGKIEREFGLGLGAYYLADVSVMFYIAQSYIVKYIRKPVYYAFQVLMIVACIVSYTRTVWIELVIIYTIAIVVKFLCGEDKSIKRFLSVIGILIVVYGVGVIMLRSNNQVIQLIVSRFTGISDAMQDETSTFAYRIRDVQHNSALYESPKAILGYGFGQLFQGINGTVSSSPENSFLYYIVKYGVVGCILLTFKVFQKLFNLLKTRKLFNIEMAFVLLVHMLIAAMSGNMNKYYSLPFVAGALILDFTLLFSKSEKENEI